jgi:hypothetical protein
MFADGQTIAVSLTKPIFDFLSNSLTDNNGWSSTSQGETGKVAADGRGLGCLRWVIAAKQDVAEAFAPATRLKRDLLVAAAFAGSFYYSCLRPPSHRQNLAFKWFRDIVPKGNLHIDLCVQIGG